MCTRKSLCMSEMQIEIRSAAIPFIESEGVRERYIVGHTIFLINFLLLLTAFLLFSLRCTISAEEGRGSDGFLALLSTLLLFCDSTWTAVVLEVSSVLALVVVAMLRA